MADDYGKGDDCAYSKPSKGREAEANREEGKFGKTPTEDVDPWSNPG